MMTDQLDDYDSELISIVAHDLKTPVGAARGFLDLVEHGGPLNELQKQYLGKAFGALERMERLIASLLDFAKLESDIEMELSITDMHMLIAESVKLLTDVAKQQDVTIHYNDSADPIFALFDARLLSHVLSNLLSNAIKYNRKGGEVWVEVKDGTDAILVDVRDNGMGMSEFVQQHAFERFYRGVKKNENGQIEGSGLGLGICLSIIERHGGKIWVESTLGEGSTFSFTMPVKPVTPETVEKSDEKAETEDTAIS
jgi:signal transduction histidine kinase